MYLRLSYVFIAVLSVVVFSDCYFIRYKKGFAISSDHRMNELQAESVLVTQPSSVGFGVLNVTKFGRRRRELTVVPTQSLERNDFLKEDKESLFLLRLRSPQKLR
ncbi:uncharacterized protein LOC106669227 [Cimex lectularius]|uniref:Uncharacterized protein n=1 Tax=Cimex lectularius TaxID=79782 RepID=A0A8I6RZA6_CIMLE|nr:uncharacterized protein LOC106669227 [Cimex lectularius]